MKFGKRFIAALICMMLIVTSVPAFGEETLISATEEPAVTEEAIVTEEPVETEEPAATEEAVETEEPVATEEAVETEEPVATEEAVETEEPAATEEAVETEEPAATEEHVVTEEPAETEEPAAEAEPGIMPLSLDVDTEIDNLAMSVGVDDIIVGKSFRIAWERVENANHYEVSVVRINSDDTETRITSASRANVERKETSYTVSASYVTADAKAFRIYVGAASEPYPCDYWKMLCSFETTVTVRADENREMDVIISVLDKGYSIKWDEVKGADYYLCSFLDITDNTYVYNRQRTTGTSLAVAKTDIAAGHEYKIWTGAYAEGSDEALAQHLSDGMILLRPCDHPVTKMENVVENRTSLDENQHHLVKIYDLVCQSCGEIVEEGKEESDEPHTFDEAGDCTKCDYRYSCPHTEKKTVLKGEEASPLEDGLHHQITKTYSLVCANPACGKVLVELDSSLTEKTVEEHQFSGNQCTVCSYVKAEKLSIIVSRDSATAYVGDMLGASVSVAGGSGDYSFYWEVYCNDTLINAHTAGDDRYNWTADQAGSWKFSVTVTDNATQEMVTAETESIVVSESECAHESATVRVLETKYERISDTKHNVIQICQRYCDNCGAKVGAEYESITAEDHHFENHVCKECGTAEQTEECQHPESVETELKRELVNLGTSGHQVVITWQDACKICGSILNQSRTTVTVVPHELNDQGTCACGYIQATDTCDHAPEMTVTDTAYAQYDEERHAVTETLHYECECGQVNYDEVSIRYERHSFADGVCQYCGYAQAAAEETVSGSFDSAGYTMTAGQSLTVKVSVAAVNGELAKATINGKSDVMEAPVSVEIPGGTAWSGEMVIDGAKAPFNTTGTYEVQLWVKTQSGYSASVATATVIVEEVPETDESVSGSFDSDSYTMTAGQSLTVKVSVAAENGELAKATINGKSDVMEAPVSVEIPGGTAWSGEMVIDGTSAPFNTPGTYEVQLWVKTQSGYSASVATATVIVEPPEGELYADNIAVSCNAPSGCTVGKYITASIKVYGGSGSYEYSWYLHKVSGGSVDESAGGKYCGNAESTGFNAGDEEGQYCLEAFVKDKKNSKLTLIKWSTAFEIRHGSVTEYAAEHPHDLITYCPDHPDHVTDRQPSNYKADNCCDCGNHDPGDNLSKHSDGKWYVTCKRCGADLETTVVCQVYGEAHNYVSTNELNPNHTAAGHAVRMECACGRYYWSNSQFQKKDDCCECVGHEWGEAYEENGQWWHNCTKCGKKVQIGDTGNVQDSCDGVNHVFSAVTYDKEHPHQMYLSCECGEKLILEGVYAENITDCCECGNHDWGEVVNSSLGYLQVCSRCHERITVVPSKSQLMKEIFQTFRTAGTNRLFEDTSKDVVNKLTDPGFVGLNEIINTTSDVAGQITDMVLKEKDEIAIEKEWEALVAQMLVSDFSNYTNEVYADKSVDADEVALFLVEVLRKTDSLTGFTSKIEDKSANYSDIVQSFIKTLAEQDSVSDDDLKFLQKLKDMDAGYIKNVVNKVKAVKGLLTVVGDVSFISDLVSKSKEEYKTYVQIAEFYDENIEKLDNLRRAAKSISNVELLAAVNEVEAQLNAQMKSQYASIVNKAAEIALKEGTKTVAKEGVNLIIKAVSDVCPWYRYMEFAGTVVDWTLDWNSSYEAAKEMRIMILMNNAIKNNVAKMFDDDEDAAYQMTELYTTLQIAGIDCSVDFLDAYETGRGLKISEFGYKDMDSVRNSAAIEKNNLKANQHNLYKLYNSQWESTAQGLDNE